MDPAGTVNGSQAAGLVYKVIEANKFILSVDLTLTFYDSSTIITPNSIVNYILTNPAASLPLTAPAGSTDFIDFMDLTDLID